MCDFSRVLDSLRWQIPSVVDVTTQRQELSLILWLLIGGFLRQMDRKTRYHAIILCVLCLQFDICAQHGDLFPCQERKSNDHALAWWEKAKKGTEESQTCRRRIRKKKA